MYIQTAKRIAVFFTLCVVLVLSGCETEPSEQIAISVTPNHVTLRPGQSREFTASGWQDYTWSISDREIGVLSTSKGNSTVYTAVGGGTNAVQILTVTASGTRTNATSGTANTISSGAARALITHR